MFPGELTLPLAVCTNQSEVDDFLLENSYHWVDVRERDSLGNMVLHALVVVSTDNTPENTDFIASMYDYITSPLLLACTPGGGWRTWTTTMA